MSETVMLWVLAILVVVAWVAYPMLMWRLVCATFRFAWGVVHDAFALLLAWI